MPSTMNYVNDGKRRLDSRDNYHFTSRLEDPFREQMRMINSSIRSDRLRRVVNQRNESSQTEHVVATEVRIVCFNLVEGSESSIAVLLRSSPKFG